MNRTTSTIAAATAAVLLLAACSGGDEESAPTTDATTTTEATTTSSTTSTTIPTTEPPVTTTTVPDILRMPLTGEPLDDPSEIPDRPALAVKIPNNPEARPQTGLNEADVVFEEIVEGGITRFIAIFHTDGSDPVGPIRSGRSQDINILTAFNRPLFAWSGGNAGVTNLVRNSELIDLDMRSSTGYYRRSGRGGSPHNLFSSTDALWAQAPDDAEPPTPVFPYLRDDDVIDGESATTIEVVVGDLQVRWEYDPESNRYYRWQGGREHGTELTGQVWTDNLVVMMADYRGSRIDATSPEAQMLGSNPVHVFVNGTVRSGVWLRFTPQDRFAFFDNVDDLNEIPLRPGRTFVELPRNTDETVGWSAPDDGDDDDADDADEASGTDD